MNRHPLLPPDFERANSVEAFDDFWAHQDARMRRHRRVTLAFIAGAWTLCALIIGIGLWIAVTWLIDIYLTADAATIMMF